MAVKLVNGRQLPAASRAVSGEITSEPQEALRS
jgi:hypothetical protein